MARDRTDESKLRSEGDGDGQRRPPAEEGRHAERPRDIPARGFKAVGARVVNELRRDHVSLLAAGIAFKALLALFPAIIAALSIWGLVASEEQITAQISNYTEALPEDAAGLIEDQLASALTQSGTALSIALIVSILVALWSASGGMAGLIEGCNAAYDEVDDRSFPVRRALALLMTLGGIVFVAIALGLIAVLPPLLDTVGLEGPAETAIRIGQWPLLGVIVMVALGVIYKYAPNRDRPRTRWVSWGAVFATVLWLAGSALFTVYVENFSSFDETYGAFAGIIVLMLWLFLSAFIVLLGAEVNAELERQTARDTTIGRPEPRGQRGAVAADTTPEDYERREEAVKSGHYSQSREE